jgi:lysophospholipase L1-like esterase
VDAYLSNSPQRKCADEVLRTPRRIEHSLHRKWCNLVSAVIQLTLLLSCVVTVATDAQAKDPSLNRFELAIAAFEMKDKIMPPPENGTLFIGSSTFTKWTALEKEFRDFKAINRGFGGSTIPEINNYVSRIVTKYKPKRIVFYAGTNDIAEGHSGQQVSADFETFAKKVQADLPNTEVYFISMSVAPSRVQWQSQYETGNALIRSFVEHTPHFHYIDVTPAMHDKQGKLRDDYFIFDRLHMTPSGYAAWTPIIRQALLSEVEQSHGESQNSGQLHSPRRQ